MEITFKLYSLKLMEDFRSWVAKTDPSPKQYRTVRRETLFLLAQGQREVKHEQPHKL